MAVGGQRAFVAKAVALLRAWDIRACFMDRVVFKFSGDGGLMNMKPRSNLCDIPSFQKTGLDDDAIIKGETFPFSLLFHILSFLDGKQRRHKHHKKVVRV